jgi:hypothetical protein
MTEPSPLILYVGDVAIQQLSHMAPVWLRLQHVPQAPAVVNRQLLWAEAVSCQPVFEEADAKLAVEVTTYVIPLPDAGKRFSFGELHSTLLELSISGDDVQLFETPLLQALVHYKWHTYGRAQMVRDLRWHSLTLLIMMTFSLLSPSDFEVSTAFTFSQHSASTVILSLAALAACRSTFRELRSAYCYSRYWRTLWNIQTAAELLLMLSSFAAFVTGGRAFPLLFALALYLKWLGLVYYLQGFESTGALVQVILRVSADVRWFMLVLAVFLVGLANAFYFLLTPESTSGYVDFAEGLFTTFNMMILADFNTDDIAVGPFRVAIKLVFVPTMVLVSILLVNLLVGK